MSWLSAAWDRNKGAIASIGGNVLTGNLVGAGKELLGDAQAEAKRVIARTGAPPEAQATMLATATNALNAAGAAAGIRQPSYLNPLGVQGQQRVAIGGMTFSVNEIAVFGLAVILLVVVVMMRKR